MAEKAKSYRELHAQRLEKMLGSIWELAQLQIQVKPSARSEKMGRFADEVQAEIALKAQQNALRIMERMARLLNLDAPTKVEVSGPDGGAVPVEVMRAQLLRLAGATGTQELPKPESATEPDSEADG
jgi:leucyl aminopeptidase (aminopeptidase T)